MELGIKTFSLNPAIDRCFFLHICHGNITEVITASARHSLMKVQPQCVGSVMCARASVRVCSFGVKCVKEICFT